MPFIAKKNVDFVIEQNRIRLTPSFFDKNKERFKKITGTRFAAILQKSPYNTPFKIWVTMTNIFKDDVDPFFVEPGKVIEPKIKDFFEAEINTKYVAYDPAKYNWDLFKSNPIFGGIPDGEPVDHSGNLDYSNNKRLLEIKTSSFDKFQFQKKDEVLKVVVDTHGLPVVKNSGAGFLKWFPSANVPNVPEEYLYQVGLYCYLRNWSKATIVVGFLKTLDYIRPDNFSPSWENIKFIDIDINLEKMQEAIVYATHWYENYIKTGVSPEFSEQDALDLQLMNL